MDKQGDGQYLQTSKIVENWGDENGGTILVERFKNTPKEDSVQTLCEEGRGKGHWRSWNICVWEEAGRLNSQLSLSETTAEDGGRVVTSGVAM